MKTSKVLFLILYFVFLFVGFGFAFFLNNLNYLIWAGIFDFGFLFGRFVTISGIKFIPLKINDNE